MSAVLLASPDEQDNADTHRIDEEQWTGRKISDLKELLPIIETGGRKHRRIAAQQLMTSASQHRQPTPGVRLPE